MPKEGVFAVVIRGGQIRTGDEVKLIPANIYASIKDRPADSRCEAFDSHRRSTCR